jgi:hypothetical protein
MFQLCPTQLRRVRKMLNAEAIEKAIALCEKGTTESILPKGASIQPRLRDE